MVCKVFPGPSEGFFCGIDASSINKTMRECGLLLIYTIHSTRKVYLFPTVNPEYNNAYLKCWDCTYVDEAELINDYYEASRFVGYLPSILREEIRAKKYCHSKYVGNVSENVYRRWRRTMGEYYDWVNVDKKQYLIPMEFGHGCKIYESCWYQADVLGALYSLLSNEWKGDHIVYLGEDAKVPKAAGNETLRRIRQQCLEDNQDRGVYDYYIEEYKCLSGLFKAAEEEVRKEIGIILRDPIHYSPNQYGIDLSDPYKGLFNRELAFFRYVINRDRKEYYDTKRTRWQVSGNRVDPLPLLMAYGRMTGQEENPGLWLGDFIDVSDTQPGEEYTDISDSCVWEDM